MPRATSKHPVGQGPAKCFPTAIILSLRIGFVDGFGIDVYDVTLPSRFLFGTCPTGIRAISFKVAVSTTLTALSPAAANRLLAVREKVTHSDAPTCTCLSASGRQWRHTTAQTLLVIATSSVRGHPKPWAGALQPPSVCCSFGIAGVSNRETSLRCLKSTTAMP